MIMPFFSRGIRANIFPPILYTYNLYEKMLFKIEIGISYNGIVYDIDSVDLKTEWVSHY